MKYLLQNNTLTILPEISLVLFFLVFTGVIVWVMRPSAKAKYEAAGRLPLESDEKRNKV